MKSVVYFIDLRTNPREGLIDKFGKLIETAGIAETIKKRDLVAIKLHFGALGNTGFIRPVFIRKVVECAKSAGGTPFLTDCNTLYAGSRSDTPTHIETAVKNGFAYSVVDAPIVIADGLRGRSEVPVAINRKHFDTVYIGSDIVHSDALISVAHFKGHELTGFAGTLKNIGMGCASRRGKLAQHSGVSPKVKSKKCIGCGDCEYHCPEKAISLNEGKASISTDNCIGCGECIIICPTGAVQIKWNPSIPVFIEKMIEYTMGVLKGKGGKMLFINFLTHISPACDCLNYSDAPIVRDIGILASTDPVAIDKASVDFVNQEQALPKTCMKTHMNPGEDKFKSIYPNIEWSYQFDYAESLGLGTRNYEIETIKSKRWKKIQ